MIVAASVLNGIGHALSLAGSMTWEILWALILGFALAAVVQAVVRKSEVVKLLGDDRPRTLAIASGLGAASSSCSYAAVALARSRSPPPTWWSSSDCSRAESSRRLRRNSGHADHAHQMNPDHSVARTQTPPALTGGRLGFLRGIFERRATSRRNSEPIDDAVSVVELARSELGYGR